MLIGIVGKPSAGKSSFLNALTKSNIAKVANYPFTTIDPNIGVGYAYRKCVCEEMKVTCGKCINNLRPVPIKIIDVAGLVPGANEGKGRGNQFLSDLGQADLLIHVIDASGSLNEEGEDVEPGSHDPLIDVRFLEDEIEKWIYGILENGWDKFIRVARSSKAPLVDIFTDRLSGLKINKNQIRKVLASDTKYPKSITSWNNELLLDFAKEIRKYSKPILLVANKIDRPSSKSYIGKIKQFRPDTIFVSALTELTLQNLDKQEKIKYFPLENRIEVLNLTEKEKQIVHKIEEEILVKHNGTGIPNILSNVVDMLNYITAYPVADGSHLTDQEGRILPDVHLVPKGTTAKELAGRIHKDLMENFICGIDVRTNRKLGESYELQDRDIIKIMSSK